MQEEIFDVNVAYFGDDISLANVESFGRIVSPSNLVPLIYSARFL